MKVRNFVGGKFNFTVMNEWKLLVYQNDTRTKIYLRKPLWDFTHDLILNHTFDGVNEDRSEKSGGKGSWGCRKLFTLSDLKIIPDTMRFFSIQSYFHPSPQNRSKIYDSKSLSLYDSPVLLHNLTYSSERKRFIEGVNDFWSESSLVGRLRRRTAKL